MTIKAIIFDADGVLIDDSEIFIYKFNEIYDIDHEFLLNFFRGEFRDCIIGNADLRKILPKYLKMWNIKDTPENFMLNWFETENKLRKELIDYIQNLRDKIKIFVGTNQEKYRTNYLLKEMNFKNLFDDVFAAYIFKVAKPQIGFYENCFRNIQNYLPEIKPDEILFFDDNLNNVEGAKQFGFISYQYINFQDCKKIIDDYFQ